MVTIGINSSLYFKIFFVPAFNINTLINENLFFSPIEWLEYNNYFVKTTITPPKPTILSISNIDIYLKHIILPPFCKHVLGKSDCAQMHTPRFRYFRNTTTINCDKRILVNHIAYVNNYVYILWRKRIRLTRFAVFRLIKRFK